MKHSAKVARRIGVAVTAESAADTQAVATSLGQCINAGHNMVEIGRAPLERGSMYRWLLALLLGVGLPAMATAQTWTDDPLVPRVTVVQAVHVNELRVHINARRVANGLSNFTFSDPSLAVGVTPVRAVHVSEMRTALSEAYTAAGRPVPVFTDPVLTPQVTVIKAVHIEELRAAVSNTGTQSPVNLRSAIAFAILTKSGITNTPSSAIVGDVGSSPITGAAIHLTCPEVVGTIYAVDAAGPAPCAVNNATLLGTAVLDMGTAYEDAAGRVLPDFFNLGAGEIGGRTLTPGLYKWGTGVLISSDVTLFGGPNDVWIFQISGPLSQANGARVNLGGGALAKNIFWQVTEQVTIGTGSHFEGVVLTQTMINLTTGASVNGRLFAHTAVTLQMNAVTEPAP
jgi:hypothetical protein